jgi:hypothetical protein
MKRKEGCQRVGLAWEVRSAVEPGAAGVQRWLTGSWLLVKERLPVKDVLRLWLESLAVAPTCVVFLLEAAT